MTSAADSDSRTYFRSLDAAMGDFALPLGAVDRVRDILHGFTYEHVFIPASRDYIALEALGVSKPVAFITELYIALHPADGESQWIELPGAASRAAAHASVRAGADSDEPLAQWELDLPMGEDLGSSLDPSGEYTEYRSSLSAGTATATLAKPAARKKKNEEPVVATCASCFTNLPATGRCDYCG
ncbi:hypothetical protein [Demequina globuliformis]|uniref:hypothetical protein n=1 Tax=Demequina globuliformis TaxID=676202 RepID=UPI00128CF444|nr:hypothetical protein [Demequina globuliformis]